MAVEILTGFIGGGKSYNAVLRVLDHLAKGGTVVTNLNLCVEKWMSKYPDYVNSIKGKVWKDEDDTEYNALGIREVLRKHYGWNLQKGQISFIDDTSLRRHGVVRQIPAGSSDCPVLCVFDEAADFWDSLEYKNSDREFLSLVRHSRKLNIDFVFIIQDISELNKRIRNQCQYLTRCIDMDTFVVPGLKLTLRWIPWIRGTFRVVKFFRSQWENQAAPDPVSSRFVPKDVNVYGCYRTDAVHMDLPVKVGETTDYRGFGAVETGTGFSWGSLAAGFAMGIMTGLFL